MSAEQIELMKEQLPKVREAVEVLKEVIETDVRTVPDCSFPKLNSDVVLLSLSCVRNSRYGVWAFLKA